jgi:hypothetical protein
MPNYEALSRTVVAGVVRYRLEHENNNITLAAGYGENNYKCDNYTEETTSHGSARRTARSTRPTSAGHRRESRTSAHVRRRRWRCHVESPRCRCQLGHECRGAHVVWHADELGLVAVSRPAPQHKVDCARDCAPSRLLATIVWLEWPILASWLELGSHFQRTSARIQQNKIRDDIKRYCVASQVV